MQLVSHPASQLCACMCILNKNVRRKPCWSSLHAGTYSSEAQATQLPRVCTWNVPPVPKLSRRHFLSTYSWRGTLLTHVFSPPPPHPAANTLNAAGPAATAHFLFCGAENKQAFLNRPSTDKGRGKRAKTGGQRLECRRRSTQQNLPQMSNKGAKHLKFLGFVHSP